MFDLIVIGGGAAGMAASIICAERGKSVLVLDKNHAPGKKLYATGNGRCNLTNANCVNTEEILLFFRNLGLAIVTSEQGRIYPASGQAADVVFVLEKAMKELGVIFKGGVAIEWIEKKDDTFIVSSDNDSFKAKNILIATGGKAAPKFGSTGDGYTLARQMGHEITKPIPVLTGIECDGDFSELKGVRYAADCTLLKNEEFIFREYGEVQFTDYGLSGICIFNISRHLLIDEDTDFSDYEISLDFSNGMDIDEIVKAQSQIKGFQARDILRGVLPGALAADIVKKACSTGDVPDIPADRLSESTLRRVSDITKVWRARVKRAKGWQMAQCTKGGVQLSEIDMQTMQSNIMPGLYFAGEVIDIDGPCGGYNLQNAWETGIRAGQHV